jgi:hypothetical protein
VAIEPALLGVLFGFFTIALLRLASDGTQEHAGLQLLAPIFGVGAAGFAAYAVGLLLGPLRTLRDTYAPIFIVDGYLRTRGRDDLSQRGSRGYIAALLEDGSLACEWPAVGDTDLPFRVDAAVLEFSEFGGILSVDGRSTGALPPIANVGIRSNQPPRT